MASRSRSSSTAMTVPVPKGSCAADSRSVPASASAAAQQSTSQPTSQPTSQAFNEVRLLGRWAAAVPRVLPSGDEVVTARLVVPRADCGVDTIDCSLWRADLRRRALRLPLGSVVEVQGSLRRRFWRTPTGPASRYEVEVLKLRKAGSG